MANYLLCDTCTIIDFINGRSETLHDLLAKDMKLFINSIIEIGLLQGARDKN
jgi:predicted nucleic acid-binding protein